MSRVQTFALGLLVGVAIAAAAARADGDVPTLVADAAIQHGVSPAWMQHTASCESGYNRWATSNPPYVGLFQLGPGMQREFYGWAAGQGLRPDLFDPAQQANFAATLFAAGRSGNWPICGR